MSESYLNQTSETVQAKRGRNIEKYKASYEKELQLYKYINSYIYKLNNLRFRMNSSNYQHFYFIIHIPVIQLIQKLPVILLIAIVIFQSLGSLYIQLSLWIWMKSEDTA